MSPRVVWRSVVAAGALLVATHLAGCTAIVKDSRLSASPVPADLPARAAEPSAEELVLAEDVRVLVEPSGDCQSCILIGPLYVMIFPCGFIGRICQPESLEIDLVFDPPVALDASRIEIWMPQRATPLYPVRIRSRPGHVDGSPPTTESLHLVFPVKSKDVEDCRLRLPPLVAAGREMALPTYVIDRVAGKARLDVGTD